MEARVKAIITGDPHAHPEYDNDRFEALGNLVVAERPTHVIFPGDLGDYPSLSSHEKGSSRAEGRRVAKDEAAVADALERFWKPIRALHARQAAARRKRYKFDFVILGGNHDEERLRRVADQSPELEGMEESFIELCKEYGAHYVPFREKYWLEGWCMTHYFPSGPMGYPLSSPAKLLKKNWDCSSLAGHLHTYQEASDVSPASGSRRHAIITGGFMHPKYHETWSRGIEEMMTSGVLILDGMKDGDYEYRAWMTTNRLQRIYL